MLPPALARLGSWLFGVVGSWTSRQSATAAMSVARRYPRHSLAAGASLVILGSIWYTQMGTRGPVTTQISGGSSTAAPRDAKNTAGTTTGGDAVKSETVAAKNPRVSEAGHPGDTATVAPVAGSSGDKSAPASTLAANEDPTLQPPSLSGGPTVGHESEPAPEKAPTATDLAAVRPEPAPTPASSLEVSTPTLLGVRSD